MSDGQRYTPEQIIAMGAEEEEVEESGGGKSRMLLIVLPLLLIVGGVGGAVLSGMADPLLDMLSSEEEEVADAEPDDGRTPVGTAIFYELPEMLVNLNTAGNKRNFLKMLISLELASENNAARVETVMPRIMDNFQIYLPELRLEDLQGPGGMAQLRKELLIRVNAAVRPIRINDVLLKEMIIQ